MYRIILLLLFGVLHISTVVAQTKHWVFFANKNTTFNPYHYFDAKALQRRMNNQLPLCDSTDFPLNQNYVAAVQKSAAQLTGKSRWFNAVAVLADQQQIEAIQHLPFVMATTPIEAQAHLLQTGEEDDLSKKQQQLLDEQTASLGRSDFEAHNLDGTGIRIAVFDAGFPSVDKSDVFAHLFRNKKIVKTYDFVRNNENVYSYSTHGTMVLSCIGGIYKGKKIGMATGAEYLLARTEARGERKREEENWLEAVEWADKNGADIINSSLGYTYHRYFTEHMNGKQSLVARAANLAARKGMLVINSMGNDGQKDWKILCTPADADSVLSVGAIEPLTEYKASYSSFGPTADRRTKPNVMAYGAAIAASEYNFKQVRGTSFSSALISGFAACAWQSDTTLSNMSLFKKIEQSAHLYPYFDYAHGYGLPAASYFTNKTTAPTADTTFTFQQRGNELLIMVGEEYLKNTGDRTYNYLYYKIQNKQGRIDKYAVIEVKQQKVLSLKNKDYDNKTLYVYYKGYTQKYKLKN